MVCHLASLHDVWVLTRANNRQRIETALERQPVSGLNFLYYDLPVKAAWWKHGARGVQLYYYLWQCAVVPFLRKQHRTIQFDVVHHATFVKYWAPSALAWLPSPFVWGFVGGGDDTPRPFLKGVGWREQTVERGRVMMRKLASWDPLVRRTARRAQVAVAVTPNTAICLKRLRVAEVRLRSQVGLSAEERAQMSALHFIEPEQQMVYAGNLQFLKGVHLALRAFAKTNLKDWQFCIVGDGPYKTELESLVSRLGIQERVRFAGCLSRGDVWREMARSAFLVHPSLRDSGAYVCAEAAALARPVLCLDLAGPSLQVSGETGIRIKAETPEQVVADLAAGMQRLAGDPDLCRRMGEAGRLRAAHIYSWHDHAQWFSGLYEELISGLQK
jgi:glycosyltransferase involved in cell wall biosynthesis